MAKGDHSRVENAVNYRGDVSQNHIDNLRENLTRQNQGLENRFNVAADRQTGDYANIQSGMQDYLNAPGVNYHPSNQNFGAYGGYNNFADTGGYSPQDIQNIRARSVAPIRAIYANANADVDRQRALSGGISPNYNAAKTKMARELSYALGDMNTNVEAQLAQDIRSGKLAGLGGMTGIDTSRMQQGLANASNDLQGQTVNRTSQLNALNAMTNLFGATPGMTNMAGNQLLNSSGQQLQTESLQNQLAQMIMNGTLGMSGVAGNYQNALGNIGGTLGLAGQTAAGLSGLGGLFNSGGGGGLSGLPGGSPNPF